jgi:hypothetical protein
VTWWLEYYEDGTYFWNPVGYIDTDEPKRVARGMDRILSGLV